jgi:hypothetical protein
VGQGKFHAGSHCGTGSAYKPVLKGLGPRLHEGPRTWSLKSLLD